GRRRARSQGAAVREERSRLGDLFGLEQAGAWRAALSRTWRFAAGARIPGRARSVAAYGAASGAADALCAAAGAGLAAALAGADRAVSLRPARRGAQPARGARSRSAPRLFGRAVACIGKR